MISDHLRKLQSDLTPVDRLNQIVEHGMCIGCGICESLAGKDVISLELVENGTERPIASQALDHLTMDRIISVCSGTRIEGLPKHLLNEHTKTNPVWGAWQELYLCHSAEPEVRHLASTGGVLTGLALYLLESNSVDFILHAKASIENPTFGEACISRTREDVLIAAGSRYGPTATLRDVINIIDKAERDEESFAFIGTPCDVTSLRNYAELDPRVDQYCTSMLTMVCGGFMAPTGLKEFLSSRDVNLDKVTSLRYRGYGCPGPTTIQTSDGETHEFTYLDFWGEDDSAWQLPPRCKVCADGIGDAADIAASDTWDGGSPTPEQQETDLGTNAAIVRSAIGKQIMDGAVASGHIERGANVSSQDMNRFQPHQEAKKRSVWARFLGMREAGTIVPDTQRLRIEALYNENSQQENQFQYDGTKQRVQNGKFSEPRPKPLNEPREE